MNVVTTARRIACMLASMVVVACVGLAAMPARAIEALDGRIQLHGYFEEQIRGLNENFKENFDLTQWYHILELELEFDILPDGYGPITGLSAYMGFDVRYDCVWTRACGMFRSADTFGDRASKLPVRLGNGRFSNLSGVLQASGADPENVNSLQPFGRNTTARKIGATNALGSARRVGSPDRVPGLSTLFGVLGADATIGTADDPGSYTFAKILDYKFALRQVSGSENGLGIQSMPWLPKNTIIANGTLADRVNPFRVGEANPITGATAQLVDMPFRPGTARDAGFGGRRSEARGIFIPSEGAQRYLDSNKLDSFDQNFRQDQLEWNLGASQQDEKFLREAYLDWEFLDGQLFLRTGKQSIVWGKTELFATTDQFNPRDLALASLPSLEESRIALWALRGVYSLYTVGPFEDVRFEFALNLDDFEPEDLGRCGEPYTPNPVCNKTVGLFAHGLTGYGVIGEERPAHWWNDLKGLQGGGRLEFRWDEFSFAITDIYSYTRTPYADRIFTYERNVDPDSGRPRRANAHGSCLLGTEDSCLKEADALTTHSVNQQLFAMICSSSVGFSSLDRSVCAQSVFNSQTVLTTTSDTLAHAISILFGVPFTTVIANTIYSGLAGTTMNPVVLHRLAAVDGAGDPAGGLSRALTDQQEALLGCGPLYGQPADGCDDYGIDLMNGEASVFMQSILGFDGWYGPKDDPFGIRANDSSYGQPGTRYGQARYGPVATRYVDGRVVQLPGARGPWLSDGDTLNPEYDPRIDGCVLAGFDGVAPAGTCAGASLVHPLTLQTWASEMAAFSWNYMNVLIAFSSPDSDGGPIPSTTRFYANEINEFDEFNPNRLDGCSRVMPQFCSSVTAVWSIIGNRRRDARAGGNGQFGRRDFVWAGGGEVLLRYEKRNVLGLSMDFAEDYTKSNWGVETAWVDGLPFDDADQTRGISKADTWNLTVSVDRPTFINFLNPNRTFFFNSQIFLQYITGYRNSFQATGPWNALGTFTIITGYFQDRLLPSVTFVYDVKSNSSAALPQIQYRFTESFSASVGVALFGGRPQFRKMSLEPISLGNHAGGNGAYHNATEQALAQVRDRDELFLRLRYTF